MYQRVTEFSLIAFEQKEVKILRKTLLEEETPHQRKVRKSADKVDCLTQKTPGALVYFKLVFMILVLS